MKRLVLFALLGCHGSSTAGMDSPDARESPQASAEPAELAALPTGTRATGASSIGEVGRMPAPFRGDEVLAPDGLVRESGGGYTLSAVFRPADVTGPARASEVSAYGLEQARKATEPRLAIDLSPTRLRVTLVGRGFVLPEGSEIRARADRYGHIYVWPDGSAYRPLAPGSLRALFGERSFDVGPTSAAEIVPKPESGRRIGIRTRRVEVRTRAANASFEIGKLEGAGEGGVLLCRGLLDLMNAPPSDPVCAADELPVRAELRWTSHGSLVFELTGHLKRTDLPVAGLAVPPLTASYAPAPLVTNGLYALLTHPELAALRNGDIDVPSAAPGGGDTLLLTNSNIELRMFWLDGVAAAWVAPGGRGELHGLHRGRYVGQWRTFLGDAVEPASVQVVPGHAPESARVQ